MLFCDNVYNVYLPSLQLKRLAMRLPQEHGLTAITVFCVVTMFFCIVRLYVLLVQMEMQKTMVISNKLHLEEEDTATENESNDDEEKPAKEDDEIAGTMKVSTSQKTILAGKVALVTLLTYLLLVLNKASSSLSWVGMGAVLIILLHNHILDEVRRERFDRLSETLSIVLLLTMTLHLTVYAKQQVFNGQIHEGKARIVGFDQTRYDQGKGKESVTRTDLTVAWGGAWGCPSHPNTFCQADLQGALCETDEKNRQRRLDQQQMNEEALEEENQELEDEVQEQSEEINEYEEYSEELEDALDEEVEYNEELEDTLDEEEDYVYFYDDIFFQDSYWDQMDWDKIWGEFACEDLFEADLAEATPYDPEAEPGADGWPTVNIYGNCKTCEAFIVDYFSTQHFQEVLDYRKSARNYGLATGLSLVVTMLLVLKRRWNPSAEKEIELLSRHGPTKGGTLT